MITAEQREARKKYLGASDCPAVLGIDPWRTAYDVWAEKTGRVEGFAGNDATEAGSLLESAVLDWAEKHPDIGPFGRDVMLVDGVMAANLDGVQTGHAIIEAKTTGITGQADAAYGHVLEGEHVELPERVITQVHHQFVVAGEAYRFAWVPVLIGGSGFRLYRVDRIDDLGAIIRDRCEEFWRKCVLADTPPADSRPSREVIRRLRRQPNKTITLPDELVDQLIAATAAAKQALDAEEQAKDAVRAALDDAECGTYSGGVVAYLEQTRKAYHCKESKFRTLKIKPQKKGSAS